MSNAGTTSGKHIQHPSANGGAVMLAVGALGVVYGDLGTSPLYSIREAFENEHHRLAVDRVNVLGATSIIVWTLVLIIAVKYVLMVMRADNHGEGGILALTALMTGGDAGDRDAGTPTRRSRVLVLLGLFGTALLFGDGMITPAISVMSAVEGTKLIDPGFDAWVVPLSVVILIGLFAIQRFGTGTVGAVFGPVMVLWFLTMAVLGTVSLVRTPEVLQALNPVHAVRYFQTNGGKAFLSMGSLFLVVTGGEALYADMGHFGRRPITAGWFAAVFPSLLLTYLGIGALLLREPTAIDSPFFRLAPDSLRIALIVLATAATVIASQALISGVFSLTLQAIQLGYAPRTRTVNTSSESRGQIYIPLINWALMIACVGLVLAFRSSAALAAAFGLSVTGTMFITTILFAAYARKHWHWPIVAVAGFCTVLLGVEGSFLAANAFKIPEGGWFPIVIAVVVFTQLTTWKTGRALVNRAIRSKPTMVVTFADGLTKAASTVRRVPGTQVFFFSTPGLVPPSLLVNLRANGSLAEHVYVVAIITADTPTVLPAQRVTHEQRAAGLHEVTLRYGFMERTPVAEDLRVHLNIEPEQTYYFLGRESVRSSDRGGMARWREVLFGVMGRNATDVGSWFQLPTDRVIEIGARVEI